MTIYWVIFQKRLVKSDDFSFSQTHPQKILPGLSDDLHKNDSTDSQIKKTKDWLELYYPPKCSAFIVEW